MSDGSVWVKVHPDYAGGNGTLDPAELVSDPIAVSNATDPAAYTVKLTDGTSKKIWFLPGDISTDNEAIYSVTLSAGVLQGVLVGGGGQGGNQGAGGAGAVIGLGANVPVILPEDEEAMYTITVAGTNFSTDAVHTRPGMSTTIAVEGQKPFAVAMGGGDGLGMNANIAIGGGMGASGGGAGQWTAGAASVEYWGQGSPGIPSYGHKGGPHSGGHYGGGGGYGGPGGEGGYSGNGGLGFNLASALMLDDTDGSTKAFLDIVSVDGIIAGGGAVGSAGIPVGGSGYSTGSTGSGTHAQPYTGSGGGGQKGNTAGSCKGGCGMVLLVTEA